MDVMSRIEKSLLTAVDLAEQPGCPPRLAAAMHAAVFPKGARVRPRLCHAVASACGDDEPSATDANTLPDGKLGHEKGPIDAVMDFARWSRTFRVIH